MDEVSDIFLYPEIVIHLRLPNELQRRTNKLTQGIKRLHRSQDSVAAREPTPLSPLSLLLVYFIHLSVIRASRPKLEEDLRRISAWYATEEMVCNIDK